MKLTRFLQTVALSLAFAATGVSSAAAPVARPAARSAVAVERVNLNTADVATLDRVLVNIGPAKAQAIVDYRRTNGPFRSIDQLALVKGVGLKTIEKNRGRIVLGAVAPARTVAGGRAPTRAANLQR